MHTVTRTAARRGRRRGRRRRKSCGARGASAVAMAVQTCLLACFTRNLRPRVHLEKLLKVEFRQLLGFRFQSEGPSKSGGRMWPSSSHFSVKRVLFFDYPFSRGRPQHHHAVDVHRDCWLRAVKFDCTTSHRSDNGCTCIVRGHKDWDTS